MTNQREEDIYSTLMDATPDCVKVLDLEGRLLHMNTPGLCAMEIDDFAVVSQQKWRALWPLEAHANIKQSLEMAVKGEASSFEAYCPTAKGTPKWWDVSVSPVRNAGSGRVEQLLSISRDITHRKEVERALKLSESRLAILHSIVANPRLSNTDRLARLLHLGIDEFNLEIGVVAQITDGVYRVVLADTPDGSVSVGFSCDAKDVICVQTLRQNRLLEIESLAQSDWHTHPAYSQFGTEVYLGMPLVVEGQIFGTLCYVSRLAHTQKFNTADHEFLRLLAQTIGTEMTRQHSANRLQAAETEFRAVFEQSAVGKAQISTETMRFVRANAKFCDMVGYTAEELAELTPGDLTFAADLDAVYKAMMPVLRGEIALYELESRFVCKDGTIIWVHVNATMLRDAHGQPERTMAVIQDITQRKLAEDAVRESQQRLALAIRAGDLAIWETDRELGQRIWSPEAMAMFGLELPDGIGRFGGEHDDFRSRLHPDDRHLHEQYHRELRETGAIKSEYRIVLPNGETRWISGGASVLTRDSDGVPIRSVHIAADITQRKLVENALDESEKQFRQTVMNVAVPTIVHADDDSVLVVNHMWTHITGYRLADIPTIGHWIHLAYGERANTAKEYIDNLFKANNRLDNGEWTITTSTGEKRDWHFSSTPLGQDANGRRLLVSTAIDITDQKRSSQALLERQQFGRSVLDNLFGFVGVLTPEGILVDANRAPLEAAGISASEVIGKRFWECYWWSYATDVQLRVKDWCSRVVNGEVIRCDVQVRMAGGALMWIDFQMAPLRDEGGNITHLIPSAMDVSARRQAQDLLSAKEQKYRTLFDSMDQGYCVVDVIFDNNDLAVDYRFIEVNPAFERHTQLKDSAGQTIRALVPNIEPHWAEIYGKVARTGMPIRFIDKSNAMNGTWFDVYAFRLENQGGNRVAILFSDVSAQKRAEQQLLDSEERFRHFADSIPQLAWIADVGSEGRVGWFNKGWLDFTGTTQEDMTGVGWKSVHHPDYVGAVEQKFSHHVKNGLDWEDTFPLRGKDGKYRWFLSRMKCIRGEAGVVIQIFGTNTDISKERELESELRRVAADLSEANLRKDEFLATLAHELRNPLAPIRNGLQLMKLSGGQPGAVEQARAMMERQLTHMVRLVDDLMDASRISLGKLELRSQPISLTNVVNSAVESSAALVEEKRHQLFVKLPHQALMVDADLTRLAQVFQNLLNNAAKYSKQGGEIHLTVESQESEATVTIKDTGVGIAADQLPHIFDMFTQVDRSLDMSQGGLGIGLSLVKRLVDMHGGTVHAKSEGLGYGSEFVVTLPLLPHPTQHDTPGDGAVQPPPQSRLRILVVDDNRDAADSLAEMLELMGNVTRAAYDGQQGVEMGAEFLPDVILFDIGMPKLNGYEACRLVRQQPWGKDIVLVAATGWGQEKDRNRTSAAGFDYHLVKPVDPQELVKTLTDLSTARR